MSFLPSFRSMYSSFVVPSNPQGSSDPHPAQQPQTPPSSERPLLPAHQDPHHPHHHPHHHHQQQQQQQQPSSQPSPRPPFIRQSSATTLAETSTLEAPAPVPAPVPVAPHRSAARSTIPFPVYHLDTFQPPAVRHSKRPERHQQHRNTLPTPPTPPPPHSLSPFLSHPPPYIVRTPASHHATLKNHTSTTAPADTNLHVLEEGRSSCTHALPTNRMPPPSTVLLPCFGKPSHYSATVHKSHTESNDFQNNPVGRSCGRQDDKSPPPPPPPPPLLCDKHPRALGFCPTPIRNDKHGSVRPHSRHSTPPFPSSTVICSAPSAPSENKSLDSKPSNLMSTSFNFPADKTWQSQVRERTPMDPAGGSSSSVQCRGSPYEPMQSMRNRTSGSMKGRDRCFSYADEVRRLSTTKESHCSPSSQPDSVMMHSVNHFKETGKVLGGCTTKDTCSSPHPTAVLLSGAKDSPGSVPSCQPLQPRIFEGKCSDVCPTQLSFQSAHRQTRKRSLPSRLKSGSPKRIHTEVTVPKLDMSYSFTQRLPDFCNQAERVPEQTLQPVSVVELTEVPMESRSSTANCNCPGSRQRLKESMNFQGRIHRVSDVLGRQQAELLSERKALDDGGFSQFLQRVDRSSGSPLQGSARKNLIEMPVETSTANVVGRSAANIRGNHKETIFQTSHSSSHITMELDANPAATNGIDYADKDTKGSQRVQSLRKSMSPGGDKNFGTSSALLISTDEKATAIYATKADGSLQEYRADLRSESRFRCRTASQFTKKRYLISDGSKRPSSAPQERTGTEICGMSVAGSVNELTASLKPANNTAGPSADSAESGATSPVASARELSCAIRRARGDDVSCGANVSYATHRECSGGLSTAIAHNWRRRASSTSGRVHWEEAGDENTGGSDNAAYAVGVGEHTKPSFSEKSTRRDGGEWPAQGDSRLSPERCEKEERENCSGDKGEMKHGSGTATSGAGGGAAAGAAAEEGGGGEVVVQGKYFSGAVAGGGSGSRDRWCNTRGSRSVGVVVEGVKEEEQEEEEEEQQKGGGQLECPHCPLRLLNGVTLQNHIRVVHERSGVFVCDICGSRFMWRSTLGNHVRLVHERDRPYGCTQCELRFRWKSHLDEHVWVVHERRRPFVCVQCGKSFGRKNNMQKHKRRVHGTPGEMPSSSGHE